MDELQDGGKGAKEGPLSRDDAERLIGHMVAEGYLDLELGYTAYSTNAYLKCGRMAPRLLEGTHFRTRPCLPGLALYCFVFFVVKVSVYA
jgi:hypothetical protein